METDEDEDLFCHIAKACIAFANTYGGCLLFGIDDEGTMIGLEKSLPENLKRKNWDSWVRHIKHSIFKKTWKCKKAGHIIFNRRCLTGYTKLGKKNDNVYMPSNLSCVVIT